MKTYSVYLRHVADTDLYYVGVTSNMKKRGCRYRNGEFKKYIKDGFSADSDPNIETSVVYETSDKTLALYMEQTFISFIPKHKCLNQKNSGGKWKEDRNNAKREWYAGNEDEKKKNYERVKNRRNTPQGKLYYRVDNYNRTHPTSRLVTPQEAVEMFELTGWVPSFIKNNDLTN